MKEPPPTRSYNKIKKLYLHFLKTYGYQTLQGCDSQWGASKHETIKTFDHMITRGHATN